VLENIHWLGHASFRLEGDGAVVYLDPRNVKNPVPADVVLVTHSHFDHLSAPDIAKISGPKTVIVCPTSCVNKLKGDVRAVTPGDTLHLGKVTVEAVPAYNINKPNHPRNAGNVGYVVELGGRRVYLAGDSDLIPEMSAIRCDVALLPVGGTYTMNADEAVQAARTINPKFAVPMHWGEVVGTREDAERFVELLPQGIQGVILKVE